MNIFRQIKYYFLSLKAKSLQKKLRNTTKKVYKSKNSKTVYGTAADLTLNTQTQKLIEEIKADVTAIVKKTNCNPDELLAHIKATKTPVHKIDNADVILRFLHEEEGLICEKIGFEALYLSIMTGQNWTFKTEPMFILRNGTIDKFYMLHQFYLWYSLRRGLDGFESKTQKQFKKYLNSNSTDFNTLSLQDILSLKEAIARDREATEFVLEYTKQTEGAKKVINKIQDEGGANI